MNLSFLLRSWGGSIVHEIHFFTKAILGSFWSAVGRIRSHSADWFWHSFCSYGNLSSRMEEIQPHKRVLSVLLGNLEVARNPNAHHFDFTAFALNSSRFSAGFVTQLPTKSQSGAGAVLPCPLAGGSSVSRLVPLMPLHEICRQMGDF